MKKTGTVNTASTLLWSLAAVPGFIGAVSASDDKPKDDRVELFQATPNHGPWNVPRDDFDQFLADNADARGNYPIPGPNISASVVDPDNIDGWSWSVSVAADLPFINAPGQKNESEDPQYYTGGKVVFHAPTSLLDSRPEPHLIVDDKWDMCLLSWELNHREYPDKLRTDDGSCKSVLSDECIADLESKAVINGGSCQCPRAVDIPSCDRLGDDAHLLLDRTCAAYNLNATDLRRWKGGRLEVYAWGSTTTHSKGDTDGYNFFGSLAWPVLASFGNTTYGHTAKMSCVRATDGVDGSKAPGDDGESSASRLSGSLAMTMVALASAVLLL
ncbi:hypothetical protein GGS20DRAFT_474508 [Poronia punctata]|nr:hypothetical protein GGS20DRAFT_474508 [Poronia punctata]